MSGRAARALGAVAVLLLAAAGCSSPGGGDSGPAPSAPASARTPPSPSGSGAAAAAGRWRPAPGAAWQWQLSGTVDTSVDVPVYDIDGFENDAGVVTRLHHAGRRVICYVNAGAWESFRPDAARFPTALLGRGDGWDGERWLDIRALDRLRPLMAARFDMCRAKGFDAVEPDLVEGYADSTGFPLTAADQLAYNRMIAGLAHARGLAVGLKNDLGQVPQLLRDFDFSVDEQCAQYDECGRLSPFIAAGKPVFHVEYELKPARFCPAVRKLGFSSMAKHLSLDAWREPC
ncbi:endo alpha-1,4 polygalactosaminidase [Streptomyces sp. NBC_01477]|uniref:endo alpha-1,4 polygalactosaminidase n=1 Tax=Streptomyces sp. NBC_01477 TaxID=2976015 RepID=UPI002E351D26|nr:endo alpha-1,4 polygalactosaminidase [Streptomyces sp. NBC_01477]